MMTEMPITATLTESNANAVQEPRVSTSAAPPPALVETLEGEYIVERILDRRFNKVGQIFYLIKWQGFADQDNTWEPEQNLADCPALIADFERRLREHVELALREPEKASELDKPTPISNAAKERALTDNDLKTLGRMGFDRGLRPQRIIGATDCGGELCFLMKWRGSNLADIVPAREANAKCPQIVIKFYEGKIKWDNRRPLQEMTDEDEDSAEDDDDDYEDYENVGGSSKVENPETESEEEEDDDFDKMEEESGDQESSEIEGDLVTPINSLECNGLNRSESTDSNDKDSMEQDQEDEHVDDVRQEDEGSTSLSLVNGGAVIQFVGNGDD